MFKKRSLSFLLAFSLYSHFSLAGSGKDVGNGGGGLLLDGKHYTFSELGIKPDATDTTPYDNQVLDEIQKMLPKVLGPSRKQIIKYILSTDKPYINAEVVTPYKFKKILDDYKNALGAQFNSQDFKVYAITNDEHTFIFPDFYQLNPKQQASILIHESFFRGNSKIILAKVLKFDFELKKFNDAQETGKMIKSCDLLHQFRQLSYIFKSVGTDGYLHDYAQSYVENRDIVYKILEESNLDWIPYNYSGHFDFMLFNKEKKIFTGQEMRYLGTILIYKDNCEEIKNNQYPRHAISFKQMKITNSEDICNLYTRSN